MLTFTVQATQRPSYLQQAFTLIELSIVLVIIGLLVGVVVIGQSLIEVARINQAVSMHAQVLSAWNTFKVTYNAIPGDITNATMFWGTDDTCPSLSGSPTTSGTCNGNGDTHVIWYSYSQFVANNRQSDGDKYTLGISGVPGESVLAWQHLKLSKLLDIPYYLDSDVSVTNTAEFNHYVLPAFKRQSRAVWFIGSNRTDKADLYWSVAGGLGLDATSSNMPGNALQTGSFNPVTLSGAPMVAVTSPAMAYAIDLKLDDGKPKSGKFQTSNAYIYDTQTFLDCLISDGNGGYIYNNNITIDACRFLYSLDQ